MSAVNSQVTSAVHATFSMVVGGGPATAMSMTYASMSNSIGILMHNSVTTQFNAQIVANAALAQTCALIIASTGGG